MKKSPELKPTKYDALVVLAVLALAALCAARFWFAPSDAARSIVVSIDGAEVERLPFGDAERDYQNNGYTVHIRVTAEGVCVERADCPTQDCVKTGTISRPGQSIVCLPARIVVSVTGGAADAGYDAVAG